MNMIKLSASLILLALLAHPGLVIADTTCTRDISISATNQSPVFVSNGKKRCRTGAYPGGSVKDIVCYKGGSWNLGPGYNVSSAVVGSPYLGFTVDSAAKGYSLSVKDPGAFSDNTGSINFRVIFPNKIKRAISGLVSNLQTVIDFSGSPQVSATSNVVTVTIKGLTSRNLTCATAQNWSQYGPVVIEGVAHSIVDGVLQVNKFSVGSVYIGGSAAGSVPVGLDKVIAITPTNFVKDKAHRLVSVIIKACTNRIQPGTNDVFEEGQVCQTIGSYTAGN
jgi:hypothetical protein